MVGAVTAVVRNGIDIFCEGRSARFAELGVYKAAADADKNFAAEFLFNVARGVESRQKCSCEGNGNTDKKTVWLRDWSCAGGGHWTERSEVRGWSEAEPVT